MDNIKKELIEMWNKIILNSSFDFSSQSVISTIYDKNKALEITNEGKKNIKIINDIFKNVL